MAQTGTEKKMIIPVYADNHKKPTNTKCSVIDWERRWYIYLPLALKG
jgi:hypothetical protein